MTQPPQDPQDRAPDTSHPGTGLTEEQAEQVASLGTRYTGEPGPSGEAASGPAAAPEYLAVDGDAQAGRGADGDTAARAAGEDGAGAP